jgi:diguanylate cyclase (GGDEF)-like protein
MAYRLSPEQTACVTEHGNRHMGKPSRAVIYAAAGAALSLGAPIGLLLVREWYGAPPITIELLRQGVTYVYVFLTSAIIMASLGYALGRQTDRLAALSQTDALTGLPNDRALRSRLADEMRRAVRYVSPLSLVLLDLDGLKRINDEGGHRAGDRVIRRVATSIGATVRGSDLGARWGGDEFAIVMPSTGTAAARHLAERLMTHLHQQQAGDTGAPVTVSVGIATFDPTTGGDPNVENFVRAADEALYAAKATGRNRIRAA